MACNAKWYAPQLCLPFVFGFQMPLDYFSTDKFWLYTMWITSGQDAHVYPTYKDTCKLLYSEVAWNTRQKENKSWGIYEIQFSWLLWLEHMNHSQYYKRKLQLALWQLLFEKQKQKPKKQNKSRHFYLLPLLVHTESKMDWNLTWIQLAMTNVVTHYKFWWHALMPNDMLPKAYQLSLASRCIWIISPAISSDCTQCE